MDTKNYLALGYVRLLVTLILVGAVVALAAYAHLTLKEAKGVFTGNASINVLGVGEVLAKPDIGKFSFSVRAEGAEASEAQELSAKATNAILDFLSEQGVEDKDIKTQNYSLNPKYSYAERICPAGSFCPPGEQIIDGYEVFQTVEVKVRDLEAAGDLISGAGERGATNISGLQFTIDDEEVIKSEAREKAIADAKEKAEKLANDLGVRIVRMTGYWEDEGGHYPVMYNEGYGGEMAMDSRAVSAPSVPTGENTITSRVTISYEVK